MRFYLSHPIRGEKGPDATADDMQINNNAAIVVANYIREHITASVDIHVPAEMEDFVLIAFDLGILSEEQILDVDCAIIESCDAVLIFTPSGIVGGGCKIELDHAVGNSIPVFIGKDAETLTSMVASFITRA